MDSFHTTTLLTDEQKFHFVRRLEELLDLKTKEDGSFTWNCTHDYDHTFTIIKEMNLDKDTALQFAEILREHGGYCDCEVMLNSICGG